MAREAVERDEFRTPCSPEGIRFVQVTSDPKRDSTIACQYTIRWTPDSKRFFLYRGAREDGTAQAGIWLCDTEDGFAVRPVCEWERTLNSHTRYEPDVEGKIADTFVVSPDGRSILIMRRAREVLELCRVAVDTGRSEVVMTVPAPIATGWMLDSSADGEHVLFHVFLGDGRAEGAPWGLHVFDLKRHRTWVVELDNATHKGVQYRRGSGFCGADRHAGIHELLTHVGASPRLSDGSWRTPPDGSYRANPPPPVPGGYTVLFKDDGSGLPRGPADDCCVVALPQPPEFVASHAGWRGCEARSFVASMYSASPTRWRAPFIEAWPTALAAADRAAGRNPPAAKWIDLTRRLARADACHFDFDASGKHLVSDTDGYVLPGPCMLYVGTYVGPGDGGEPYLKTRLLGIPRTSWKGQPAHPHPFLSPDGKYAVFQSDFSGRPQVNVAYDFEYLDEP